MKRAADSHRVRHPLGQCLMTAGLFAWLLVASGLGCARAPADQITRQVTESAQSNGWCITVHSLSPLPEDPYRQPLDGQMFVAVQFTLQNNNLHTRYVMAERQMALLDRDGQAYTPEREAAVIAAQALQWLVPEGEFPPGATAQGATSFQIPLDARDLRWVFRTALHPGAREVSFVLGDAPRP